MTSPLTPNEQNAKTRASTYGIRPDLYEAMQSFMVKRSEVQEVQDALDGVSGHCAAYQSENINTQWFNADIRELPMNAPFSEESKGAHIEDSGIVFDRPGLWRVDAWTLARNTGFTGGAEAWLKIIVRNPDSSIFREHYFHHLPNNLLATLQGKTTVPISQPGMYVRVDVWSSRWRWFDGGTLNSGLIVTRFNADPSTRGDETVPDEEED